jgi:hypothetical protein
MIAKCMIGESSSAGRAALRHPRVGTARSLPIFSIILGEDEFNTAVLYVRRSWMTSVPPSARALS